MEHLQRSLTIDEIKHHLASQDARMRHEARELLVGKGVEALPALTGCLNSPDWHLRWEAVKALGEMGDVDDVAPKAAEALVGMLQDNDTGVRWAAMNSLIQLKRAAIYPVLEALTRDFGSARVREGAHHVLHSLLAQGLLTKDELNVCNALRGAAPAIEAAWAANTALMNER